jgi:hypothetical protein
LSGIDTKENKMGNLSYQWIMNRIESLISSQVNSDLNVLQGILDQLETIDVPTAMSLSENTSFHEPIFITDEGQSRYVGWQKALPAMKTKWQQAGSPPITIENAAVAGTYLPYNNAPSPDEDKDIQVDVTVTLPFSSVKGTSFHRRVCTTRP